MIAQKSVENLFHGKVEVLMVTQDREEIVILFGLARSEENASLISIEKNIIRFVGIILAMGEEHF